MHFKFEKKTAFFMNPFMNPLYENLFQDIPYMPHYNSKINRLTLIQRILIGREQIQNGIYTSTNSLSRTLSSLAPDPFFIFLFFLFLLFFLWGHNTCIACRIFVYFSPLARKKKLFSHRSLEVGLKRIMIKKK